LRPFIRVVSNLPL
jgi:hypothetical protein